MLFFFISLSTYICFLILKYRRGLITLEKEKYDTKKYINYIKQNPKDVFLSPEILGIILIIIAFNANAKVMGICTVIFYTLMFLYELKIMKDKIKINKNIISIIITTIIIYIIAFTLFIIDYNYSQSEFLIYDDTYIYYIVTILMGYLSYIIILLSNIINEPLRKIINKKGKRKKTKHKLK